MSSEMDREARALLDRRFAAFGFKELQALQAKVVPCRWRADGTCPHPARCRYGYECAARPVETVTAHVNRSISMDDETGAALDDIIAAAVRRMGRQDEAICQQVQREADEKPYTVRDE